MFVIFVNMRKNVLMFLYDQKIDGKSCLILISSQDNFLRQIGLLTVWSNYDRLKSMGRMILDQRRRKNGAVQTRVNGAEIRRDYLGT